MARVAFCQDTLIEYMSYMQMAAVLRDAGHEVELFFDDQMKPDKFVAELARYRPDVIGFSVLTPSREWAVRTAYAAREATGALTVVGNVDAILNPEAYEAEPAFDLICIGEGEYPLVELCSRIDEGRDVSDIDGFWHVGPEGIRKNPQWSEMFDMEAAPPIDRTIYDKYGFFRKSPYLRVYAGRGCPFRCSFCSNTVLTDNFGGSRRYMRKRSPQKFVEDIRRQVESRPNRINRIFIIDEVLWFDRPWLHEFLDLYRDQVGIPFTMNFKFNGGVTEDDVRRMAEAGAAAVCVATESGDESIRRGILNKPVSDQHILNVTSWMHKYGIKFGSSAFFGLPGQTFEGHLEELAFFRKVAPRYLFTTFFQPYPGLNLTSEFDVAEALPDGAVFEPTFHHDMYLDLPDRARLVNLKKVYYLMCRFPVLERPLAYLTKWRIPLLFDALFLTHFLPYALWAEGCSLRQFATHAKNFVVNPIIRRRQPLQTTARPFDIGYESTPSVAAGPEPEPEVEAVPVRIGRSAESEQAAPVGLSPAHSPDRP